MNQPHFTWDQVDGCIKFTMIYMHKISVFSLRTTNSGAIPPFTNPGAQKKSEKKALYGPTQHINYWHIGNSREAHSYIPSLHH